MRVYVNGIDCTVRTECDDHRWTIKVRPDDVGRLRAGASSLDTWEVFGPQGCFQRRLVSDPLGFLFQCAFGFEEAASYCVREPRCHTSRTPEG